MLLIKETATHEQIQLRQDLNRKISNSPEYEKKYIKYSKYRDLIITLYVDSRIDY